MRVALAGWTPAQLCAAVEAAHGTHAVCIMSMQCSNKSPLRTARLLLIQCQDDGKKKRRQFPVHCAIAEFQIFAHGISLTARTTGVINTVLAPMAFITRFAGSIVPTEPIPTSIVAQRKRFWAVIVLTA